MNSQDTWKMNKNYQTLMLEDPALIFGDNPFKTNVKTNAAEVDTAGTQSPFLLKEKDFSFSVSPISPRISNRSGTRRPLANDHIEEPTGKCPAGNQKMQHMVRRPAEFDYLTSPYESDVISLNNGFYLSGSSFHSESATGNNSYQIDGSSLSSKSHNIPYEGHQQHSYLRNSNRNTYERFWQKYGHTAFIETDAPPIPESQNPNVVFRDGFNAENAHLKDSIPGSAIRLNITAGSPCKLHNTTSNEFTSYPLAPGSSLLARQDQVLDQNLVSAAKYVYELTDGGSRPTSRASSNYRTPDAKNSVGANANHLNDIENTKIASDCSKWSSKLTASSENAIDGDVIKRMKIEESPSRRLSCGIQESPQPIIPDDIALAAQLNQLSLSNLGPNDMNSSQSFKTLLNLLTSNPTNAFLLPRRTSTSNDSPQPLNNWNSQIFQGQPIPSANNISANQLLNSLIKFNPVLLNSLLTCSKNGQADLQQILLKPIAPKPNTSNATHNNFSLLSSIGGLLSTEAARNNEFADALTSQLTAYAARFDSGKSLQSNGHQYPSKVYNRQNVYQPTNFNNDFPFSSLCPEQYCNRQGNPEGDIDRAATVYRNSASNASGKLEAIHRWNGKLPMRNYNSMCFSRKVFLGGVPWESTSDDLISSFSQFGNVSVLWPQKDGGFISHHHNNDTLSDRSMSVAPKGYCYLLFEHESCVAELLAKCTRDATNGGEYFKLSSPKFKAKSVQVIPWVISDSQFSYGGSQSSLQFSYTVFVGALHGMITAEALASIMNDLFGNVIFAALDTDKHKYPIGSGRVVFRSHASYMRAVTANFVEVRTPKFTKTIQIDPFLEDSICDTCHNLAGVYFCRSLDCFQYFCPNCWQQWHRANQTTHKPLRRSLKSNSERA